VPPIEGIIMSKVIEEIRNPPEGGAITITEGGRQAILYWKRLAEKAADELESKNKELEQHKAVTKAAKLLVKVKRSKDTQTALYLASWPIALRKIEEALAQLPEEDNE